MWLNETEPYDWNNYRCDHCGKRFWVAVHIHPSYRL
jgi:hypothetical protein